MERDRARAPAPPANGAPATGESESRLRLGILGVVVMSLFTVLVARLVYLQVLTPGPGEVASDADRLRVLSEPAARGRILDAKGRVLVENRTELVVTLDREMLASLGAGARRQRIDELAAGLTRAGAPVTAAEVERRLGDPRYSPILPVPVANDISHELAVMLAERAEEFPGVAVIRQSVRRYPQGTLAAHVLGYVGRITAEEHAARANHPVPYQPDADIGRAGVESTFEDDLRGVPGERTVEVDREGRVVRTVAYRRPLAGHDIQLTIDLDVQRLVESRLAGQLDSLQGRSPTSGSNSALFEAEAGAGVVLDPNNGNVIALASYPTYDPTEFVNGISEDAYRRLSGDGDPDANALINRAIAGVYSPGSTFKLVVAVAALTRGLISPGTTFNDGGSYAVGNSSRRNAGGAAYGSVNVTRALTVSSDVFFYWIGDRFWKERGEAGHGIQEVAREFGLGSPTGIQLPGEVGGIVPDEQRKREIYEAMPPDQQERGDPRWYAGDNVNLAIGQGDLLVTPLQLANVYATFGAHGDRHTPNLLSRVLPAGTDPAAGALPPCPPAPAPVATDPNAPAPPALSDCVVRVGVPALAHHIDIPPDAHGAIESGLAGVTSGGGGTATRVFEGFDQGAYPVLGKTGTVETGPGRADNSAFVAMGPIGEPRHVALAYLEHAGFGAAAAAPVVRSMLDLLSGQQADPCAPSGRARVPCRPPPPPMGPAP